MKTYLACHFIKYLLINNILLFYFLVVFFHSLYMFNFLINDIYITSLTTVKLLLKTNKYHL